MSTISAGGLTSNSQISSTGSTLQITGLASGLDTNSIIQALLSIEKQPITNLTHQQSGLKALNTQLSSIQTGLRTLALNAQALGDPGLFANSQTVSSSNSTLVSATTATGAGTGGYQVDVTQLANSAQRTFTFASPTSADTITIDGHDTPLAANASIQDFVNAINSDSKASVYAATTDDSTVVLSSRTTGDTGTNFIQVADPAASLSEQASFAFTSPTADTNITINGHDTVLDEAAGEVLIEVADDGPGIPLELQDRIYEPFFTTKEIGRGSGQGLALARTTIEQHMGSLACSSRPGEGATFTIRLPVVPPPGELSQAQAA